MSENLKTYAKNLENDNQFWNRSSILGLLGLTKENQTLAQEVAASADTWTDDDWASVDYVGMILPVLAPYDVAKTNIYKMLKDNLSKDGVKGWDQKASGAATAQVIIGLIADGKDPRAEEYQTEGTNLIDALLAFKMEKGFKNLLEEESIDTAFTTPQAFAALVVYREYLRTEKAVNLFL